MIEMLQNQNCLPYNDYVERWKYLKKRDDIKKKISITELQTVDDSLLPSLEFTLPIAMNKIKANKKCVPFDLYIKRWNELKVLTKHKKKFS